MDFVHKTQNRIAVNEMFSYFWSKSGSDIVLEIFPNAHTEYLKEKTALLSRSPMHFWSALDANNQDKIVVLAHQYAERSERGGG